jgi:hypothetical protein
MNHTHHRPFRHLLPSLLPVLLLSGLAASAQIVSVNLIQNPGNNAQQIDATETFGIASLGSVVGGWHNINTGASNLTDAVGITTSLDVSLTQPNGQATFNSAYTDTPLFAGLDDYTTTASPVSVTLSDLNATFSSGYFAIVYVGGFNANTGASITDGTTTYFYRPLPSPSAPVNFVQTLQTTDLGDGNNPTAQYAVFGSYASPLTADSITFTLDTLYGGGAAIGGLQIVAVPEPASFSLALMGGLGLLLLAQRRSRQQH